MSNISSNELAIAAFTTNIFGSDSGIDARSETVYAASNAFHQTSVVSITAAITTREHVHISSFTTPVSFRCI